MLTSSLEDDNEVESKGRVGRLIHTGPLDRTRGKVSMKNAMVKGVCPRGRRLILAALNHDRMPQYKPRMEMQMSAV